MSCYFDNGAYAFATKRADNIVLQELDVGRVCTKEGEKEKERRGRKNKRAKPFILNLVGPLLSATVKESSRD